jgi:hypothetical protein
MPTTASAVAAVATTVAVATAISGALPFGLVVAGVTGIAYLCGAFDRKKEEVVVSKQASCVIVPPERAEKQSPPRKAPAEVDTQLRPLSIVAKKEEVVAVVKTEIWAKGAEKSKDGFVVVHIWRPRSKDGKFKTSWQALFGGESGHVSLSIYTATSKEAKISYVSFYPSVDGKKAPGSRGVLHTFAEDLASAKRPPDVSISLFGLDMKQVEMAFMSMKGKTDAGLMTWNLRVPLNVSIASPQKNCGTFVWKILEAGGINRYYLPSIDFHLGGPKDVALRRKYICDEGRLLWGWKDYDPSRKENATPVLGRVPKVFSWLKAW